MIREWLAKLRQTACRRRMDDELREEIQAHLQMQVDENLSQGMEFDAARRAALRDFGNAALVREYARDAWVFGFLEDLWRDIRFGCRSLRKSPGFVVAVTGTLALGLGALAAAFSIFDAVVLKPFAVRDPQSLYAFIGWGRQTYIGSSLKERPFSRQEFLEFSRDNPAFSEVAGYQNGIALVNDTGAPIQAVTGNYFSMLGGRICKGRPLLESDNDSGRRVVVASHVAWESRLGADPDIVGSTVRIGGMSAEVVGIACAEFRAPQLERVDFWASLPLSGQLEDIATRSTESGPILDQSPDDFPRLSIVGRLKPGLTKESAEMALLAYGRRAYLGWKDFDRPPEKVTIQRRATSIPLDRKSIGLFMPLFLSFGLVLLIACANVSNMMLARGLSRTREIGIRISLGAGRIRMLRQLLTENLLLALAASFVAFGVSYGIIRTGYWLLLDILPSGGMQQSVLAYMNLPGFLPDLRVMSFLLSAGFLTTMVFGLAPAIHATSSGIALAVRGGSAIQSRPAWLRNGLVIGQAAFCALLLIISGTAIHNVRRISTLNYGGTADQVFKITVSEKNRRPVLDRLASLPDTVAVGSCIKPAFDSGYNDLFHPRYIGQDGAREIPVLAFPVSPEYFNVYKIPIRGRNHAARPVDIMQPGADWDGLEVVVSDAAARLLWPSGGIIGRALELRNVDRVSGKTVVIRHSVVGMAGDAIGELFDSGGYLSPNRAVVYWLQPSIKGSTSLDSIVVRMKGNRDEARLFLERELQKIIPGGMQFRISAMSEELEKVLYPYRVVEVIAEFLGSLALLLTISGVFGMFCYVVTQRRKEFGVRISLGAGRAKVSGMILRNSLQLGAIGSFFGVLMALVLSQVFAHSVHGFDLFHAGGYIGGFLIVVASAAAASSIPALRAVSIDPAAILHCD